MCAKDLTATQSVKAQITHAFVEMRVLESEYRRQNSEYIHKVSFNAKEVLKTSTPACVRGLSDTQSTAPVTFIDT